MDVERPAGEVYAYATDPARFHEWRQGVLDVHMADSGTPPVGSRCHTIRQIGSAKRPVTAEVTHLGPPHALAVRGVDGPIRAHVDVSVTEVDQARSRLVIDLEFTGHGND